MSPKIPAKQKTRRKKKLPKQLIHRMALKPEPTTAAPPAAVYVCQSAPVSSRGFLPPPCVSLNSRFSSAERRILRHRVSQSVSHPVSRSCSVVVEGSCSAAPFRRLCSSAHVQPLSSRTKKHFGAPPSHTLSCSTYQMITALDLCCWSTTGPDGLSRLRLKLRLLAGLVHSGEKNRCCFFHRSEKL